VPLPRAEALVFAGIFAGMLGADPGGRQRRK